MNEDINLSGRQVLAILVGAVALCGPPIAFVELQIGPGEWVVSFQDRLLGYHFPVSSVAILTLAEILAICALILPIALVLRRLTGKTLIDLIHKK